MDNKEKMYDYEGEIDEIVYYNEENGYGIFDLKLANNLIITCVGTIYDIYIGQPLKVFGNYVEHKVYGKQLKVEKFQKLELKSEINIIRYLSSGVVKGIGEKTAERIVNEYGMDTFDVIENDYMSLASIKGITREKAEKIHEEFMNKSVMRDALIELQQYDISINMATKIYEKFKDRSLHLLTTNPYFLIGIVDDFNFKYADELARKMGISIDFDMRIEEGIRYALKIASANGHTYLPRKVLLVKVRQILEVNEEKVYDAALESLKKARKIVICKLDEIEDSDNDRIYLKNFYDAEENIIYRIKEILSLEKQMKDEIRNTKKNHEKHMKDVKAIASRMEINLSEEQFDTVMEAIENDLLIITGGPGTGKTTIIKVIAEYFEANNKKVSLVAPTGRAAKRMTEAALKEAKTMHRLLEVNPMSIENESQHFMRNEENPLEADVIIVDEMSMVDLMLFNNFLKAVPYGAKVILVGDDKQLPSVGAGNVLRDLINSEVIKTKMLNKIFRQAESSLIIQTAHKIRNEQRPNLKEKGQDFFFVETKEERAALKFIKELIKERLPKYISCASDEIQVLTPMKKGVLGTQNLNVELQDVINPTEDFTKLSNEIKYGNRIFKVGDKIMQIKNNYNVEWKKYNDLGFECDQGAGVFNGDVGKITTIDTLRDEIKIKFDDDKEVRYETSMLKELDHAYAMTVHKSQGSEYKAVVMVASNVPEPLANRNILYTGITRAKQMLVLVGNENSINCMIGKNDEEKRYSYLKDGLREMRICND